MISVENQSEEFLGNNLAKHILILSLANWRTLVSSATEHCCLIHICQNHSIIRGIAIKDVNPSPTPLCILYKRELLSEGITARILMNPIITEYSVTFTFTC